MSSRYRLVALVGLVLLGAAIVGIFALMVGIPALVAGLRG